MEGELLKYGWLIVLTLSQVILFWVKNSGRKNNRKNSKPQNPGYGERIATLETEVKNIKDDIEEIKGKLNKK